MKVDLTQSGGIGILTLDGKLTSEHQDELKTLLMKALHNFDHIVLNLGRVASIDLTCNDLLCSAYKKSIELDKSMRLVGISSAEVNCSPAQFNFPVIGMKNGL